MAPKKRPASEIDDPSKGPSYSVVFPLFADADLVVLSSDNVFFATKTVHLRSASAVFDNLLGMPVRNDQERCDGRPLLKLDERASLIEILLRYTQRDRLFVHGKLPEPDWSIILLLVDMFNKYDSPLLAHSFLSDQLQRFVGTPRVPRRDATAANRPLEVFALSTIYGLEDLGRRALECIDFWGIREAGRWSFNHRNPEDAKHLEEGWRPTGLGDLTVDLLSKMSYQHIHRFCQLHSKVVSSPNYSWIDAAKDFKF